MMGEDHTPCSSERESRRFPARLDCLADVLRFAESVADSFGLPASLKMPLMLILDEAVSNVCHYAYDDFALHDATDPWLELVIRSLPDGMEICLYDAGRPFNPLIVPPPSEHDLALYTPGGLGIYFIRHFSHEIDYRRDVDQNVLRMVLHWSPEGNSSDCSV